MFAAWGRSFSLCLWAMSQGCQKCHTLQEENETSLISLFPVTTTTDQLPSEQFSCIALPHANQLNVLFHCILNKYIAVRLQQTPPSVMSLGSGTSTQRSPQGGAHLLHSGPFWSNTPFKQSTTFMPTGRRENTQRTVRMLNHLNQYSSIAGCNVCVWEREKSLA